MLPSIFVLAILAFQTSSREELTPEAACGPDYHEFSPPLPPASHSPRTSSLERILSSEIVVEGTAISKKTYAGHGVENDIQFRVDKVLRGTGGLTKGDLITVHVHGGFAGDDREGHVCLQDTRDDGLRVEVERSYLLPLTEESGTGAYRAEDLAGWFLIAHNGNLVPLTPALVLNKALAGKTIGDAEKLAAQAK